MNAKSLENSAERADNLPAATAGLSGPLEQVERGMTLAHECASRWANDANWHALRAHLTRMTQTLPGGYWSDESVQAMPAGEQPEAMRRDEQEGDAS